MTWKDIPRHPSKTTLRQFGLLCLAIFGGVGVWKLTHDAPIGGGVFCVMAIVGGLLGVLSPRALRPIFVGWMMAVFPIGWIVSHVLLATIFFLLFTPVALVFRLIGKDSLKLRRPQADSYWLPKPAADAASYYHQY